VCYAFALLRTSYSIALITVGHDHGHNHGNYGNDAALGAAR
jgi:hypothetical protein